MAQDSIVPALIISLMLSASPAIAADTVAAQSPVEQWRADPTLVLGGQDVDIAQFLWVARPVVVFADSPADPRLAEQLELLEQRQDALSERDVVVIVDTDPAARSSLRVKLRPRGFQLALIGKDGGVKLRKPFPWDVRELSRVIDKMPLRRQEIRDAVTASE